MSTPVDRIPGELVRGDGTEAAVRAVAVVVEEPVHSDPDVVVLMQAPAVGELLPEARVEALDDAVLSEAARIYVDGLDALLGHQALDGLVDELRAVVRADVLGPGLLRVVFASHYGGVLVLLG